MMQQVKKRIYLLLYYIVFNCFFLNQTLATEVDLEIVLAMDGSGSISKSEFELQIIGTVSALKDPSIQAAILSGPTGRVAISALIWSDAAFPKYPTDWFLLNSPQSIDVFAANLLGFNNPRASKSRQGIGGGGTGIGDGIVFAIDMIENNQYQGLRKVVDVSGDGVETDPWFKKAFKLPDARALAIQRNITINGLAILTDNQRLDEYYRNQVITGAGAFVVKANSFDAYADAIYKKLLKEMTPKISYKDENYLSDFAMNTTN